MSTTNLIPIEKIEKTIYLIRGEKVMLDRDLAALYGVATHVLKQAVRRNGDRFPKDFMFVVSPTEFHDWRSQFVISKADRTGLRHPPMAFTEQGVAMLSSVLRSKRAITEHRNHACLCKAATNAGIQRRTCSPAGRARKQVRYTVQNGLRHYSKTDGNAYSGS